MQINSTILAAVLTAGAIARPTATIESEDPFLPATDHILAERDASSTPTSTSTPSASASPPSNLPPPLDLKDFSAELKHDGQDKHCYIHLNFPDIGCIGDFKLFDWDGEYCVQPSKSPQQVLC